MDGEAQVTLGRIPRGLAYEYCLRISIYNTDRSVLAEIRKGWGGALTSSPSRNPRWKPSYALIWTNAAAARFLAEISPYLRVKQRYCISSFIIFRDVPVGGIASDTFSR